jgi:ABC-type uncharacterized transport system involved in gliding motility auxiliary subunit
MDNKKRSLISAGTLVLLAVLFVALTILSSSLLKGVRIDLTQNGLYTLNDGTLHILDNMDEPVNLYLYFSEDVSRDLPQFRSYARWADEMLDEFVDRSNGKLTLQRIDPVAFSPAEDQAAQYGLQSAPVGNAGDVLYFGLVGTNSVDDEQIIPFLHPDKEKFLEYDLAKMVSSLSHPEERKIGLISELPLVPVFDPVSQNMPESWVIYQQLDQLFDIENIQPDSSILPDDLELLVLVHPKELSESMLYQIDQYVLRGGKLLAFMDPLAEADTGGDPNDPTSRMRAAGSSTLEPLLSAWGVDFDPSKVVGDRTYALQVTLAAGQPPMRHLAIMSVTDTGINSSDVASADLNVLNFSSTGWLSASANAKTDFESLVESSDAAAPIDSNRFRFLRDPKELDNGFEPTGDQYALAARITGQAVSAFEQPPEGVIDDNPIKQSEGTGINVVLFADTDFLTDRLWVQKQNFLGQTVVNSFSDNGTLVANLVDQLLGSSDLISIRARSSARRPFSRVEVLRLSAESQFRDTEQNLQDKLAETEQKLTSMQTARQDGELTVLNSEQQEEVQRFLDQKLEIRNELRQVQHDLTQEIKTLGVRLKVINIVFVPLLIVVFALLVGHIRRRRREGEQP